MLVVHLSPNRALRTPPPHTAAVARRSYMLRAAESQRVLDELRDVTEPRLVLCDCNMTETSAAYAAMTTELRDSFHEMGWGLGLTSKGPGMPLLVQRVDYVWFSPELTVETAIVGSGGGSDHRPVVARLALTPTP